MNRANFLCYAQIKFDDLMRCVYNPIKYSPIILRFSETMWKLQR